MIPPMILRPAAGAKPVIPLDRSLTGKRILYRHWSSTGAPVEGWVKEFSGSGEIVRISRTNEPRDAGTWYRVLTLRVDEVLDPTLAPPKRKPRAAAGEAEEVDDE